MENAIQRSAVQTAIEKNSLRLQHVIVFLKKDGRHYQIIFLSSFLIFGLFRLGWFEYSLNFTATFFACIGTQLLLSLLSNKDYSSVKSALISALSICLMMKSNFALTAVLASVLSIGSKFAFRINGKHIFNPTNFGIVLTVLLSGDAWISPGQWGSHGMWIFIVGTLGFVVLANVKRVDTAMAFLLSFSAVMFFRSIIYQGWPLDFFFQQFSSGTLLLFTFFMITDPVSSPSNKFVRIVWAATTGVFAAILQFKFWVNGAPLYALFILSLFTPLLDKLFSGKPFRWNSFHAMSLLKPKVKTPAFLKLIVPSFILLTAFLMLPARSEAFCGFYVAKADASLFNKASQVILVRDGEKTVVTMSSDYSGEPNHFAMVVPVPVVLKKSDIKIVEKKLFDSFDAYSGPRLVEYWDQNPCWDRLEIQEDALPTMFKSESRTTTSEIKQENSYKVKIEAKYAVGEYDILILSAEESSGLERWLTDHGYKIPEKAKEVLEPYVKNNLKFFVVKINLEKFNSEGRGSLRPLQISFSSPRFMLPIRLGMANASGSQEMIVYALSSKGRVETVNYRTVKVPTDRNIPEFIASDFSGFYKAVFDRTFEREGKNNVYLEYSWDISGRNFVKCDPCAGNPPVYADIKMAGADWIIPGRNGSAYEGELFITRLHVRYDRKNFPQDLIFQETPNKDNFQLRYVMNHPAPGPFDCAEGKRYLKELRQRRYKELQELSFLTGWDIDRNRDYLQLPYGIIDEMPVNRKDRIDKTAMLDTSIVNQKITQIIDAVGKKQLNAASVLPTDSNPDLNLVATNKDAVESTVSASHFQGDQKWLLALISIIMILFFINRKQS